MPSMYVPDETIRCEKCESPLKYDKFKKQWEAVELYPEANKCRDRAAERVANKIAGTGIHTIYAHVPRGNVSRLLKAARRWNQRRHTVE